MCLHCRRAEREATAARHRSILMRIGLVVTAVAVSVFAGVSGLDAWKNRSGAGISGLTAAPASLEAAPVPAATAPAQATPVQYAARDIPSSVPAPGPSSPSTVVAPAPSAASAPPLGRVPVATAGILRSVIAEGRTELQNGIYALRTGDTITVHFDTPEARTRRPEKLEQIIRATLPAVHGASAHSMLAAVATGGLVPAGGIVAGQPMPRISLRGADGQSLSLSPQTRPGRDGPLVVAYRLTPSP